MFCQEARGIGRNDAGLAGVFVLWFLAEKHIEIEWKLLVLWNWLRHRHSHLCTTAGTKPRFSSKLILDPQLVSIRALYFDSHVSPPDEEQKKADVAEHPKVFGHVGLLFN